MRKRYLFTGDVARYCQVSRLTVLNWIKKGYLDSFTLPGGQNRIAVGAFIEFIERYNMPTDEDFLTRDVLIEKRYLTTGKIAEYCQVSHVAVWNWVKNGDLPAFTLPGGHYRIKRGDFREFLEERGRPIYNDFFET